MIKDYVALDIENPNTRGNSICSIGLVIVKNNEIIDKEYYLVDPEDRFDARNTEINGISASMVQDSPKFYEIWPKIKELLTNNVIVGHNITYDLNVMSKSLERYEIDVPNFNYVCTLQLSQEYIMSDSYSLDTLCDNIGYKFNHHNALEDALAAQALFENINSKYNITDLKINNYSYESTLKEKIDDKLSSNINSLYGIIKGINYDNTISFEEIELLKKWKQENMLYKQYSLFDSIINKLDKVLEDNIISEYEKLELVELVKSINESKMYNETTLGLQILRGIIEGIAVDKQINSNEIINLNTWLKNNDFLLDVYPYDKVLNIVKKVLEDGIIDDSEKQELLLTFNQIINPASVSDNSFNLEGKTFCLTGEFKSGTKAEIKNKLEDKGAIEKSGVSAKLDYLFVGGVGSDAWKFGNLGGKIAKAQELQEKGSSIQIISEEDLMKNI